MKNHIINKLFETPFGDYTLARIPDNNKNLFAWNAADHYLLKHLFSLQQSGDVDLSGARILILNDAFGALTIPLAQFSCDSYGDSFVSHTAIKQNCLHCCPDDLDKVNFLKTSDQFNGYYDIVLFKEIKNQAFLQEEMENIAQHIRPDTLIMGGIMAKNLQKNTIKLLNHAIGDTQASLAWKKARLLFVKPVATAAQNKKQIQIKQYQLEQTGETIYNLANVFSRNKLDIGTRFFLQHLPHGRDYKAIIDLGCGSGILALKMAQQYPQAKITCIDESYMALSSAKMTLEENLTIAGRDICYRAGNALTDYPADSTDLIVCNPPFHQQYVVGDDIAWQMFKQAKKTLLKGGELWIVGNRHLAYHVKLQRLFGNYKQIAANNKFVVLKTINN